MESLDLPTTTIRTNIYVLTYGQDMTSARYDIWEKAINNSMSSKSFNRKRKAVEEEVPNKTIYTIQKYRKGILNEVNRALLVKKGDATGTIDEQYVLVIHQTFCSTSELVDKNVLEAATDFLNHMGRLSVSIRTERWLCQELEHLQYKTASTPPAKSFDNITEFMKNRIENCEVEKNQGDYIEIISSDDEEELAHRKQPGKSLDSSSAEDPSVRKIPKFQPFRAKFLSRKKVHKEVKAKLYLYDGKRNIEDARKAALHESERAKIKVRNAVNALLERRAGRYKFAFEICAEQSNFFGSSCNILGSPEDIIRYNGKISSRLLMLCTGSGALSELSRFLEHDLPHTRSNDTSRSSQMYRDLQYERFSRVLKKYPGRVNLSSIDYSYAKSHCKQVKISKDSLEAYFLSSPVISSDPHIPLLKAGGSTFGRLIRSIIHEEGPSGKFYELLKEDQDYINDQKILESKEVQAIEVFSKIWGVGAATAAKLVSYGVYSIDELREDTILVEALNEQQKIGLNRYEDLLERIPRAEVEEIHQYMSSVVTRVSNNQASVFACGSYRRGALSSGDADFLILPNRDVCADDDAGIKVMSMILDELRQSGFLTDDLALPNSFGENEGPDPGSDSLSYMGVCRLSGNKRIHRRIDIKAYPGVQAPFALLYFTGDSHFNRSMRAFAKQAGLSLSDAGLGVCERVVMGDKIEKVKVGHSVICSSEREIFELLGTKYVEPTNRVCVGLDGRIHSSSSNISRPKWDILVGGSDVEEDL